MNYIDEHMIDTIDSESVLFLENMYKAYLNDFNDLENSWNTFFKNQKNQTEIQSYLGYRPHFNDFPKQNIINEQESINPKQHIKELLHWYLNFGHLHANLNPLHPLNGNNEQIKKIFSNIKSTDWLAGQKSPKKLGLDNLNINEVNQKLYSIYCGDLGIEIKHLRNSEEQEWLQRQLENKKLINAQEKITSLKILQEADIFEKFLKNKFPTDKKFSIEGCDSILVLLQAILENSAKLGTTNFILGMAHRGRLNILAHLLGKPYWQILSEFEKLNNDNCLDKDDINNYQNNCLGKDDINDYQSSYYAGDVKYHLGFENSKIINGTQINIQLAGNPSHLESVFPVVLGQIKGLQQKNKQDKNSVMGIICHGDAAFVGQGVVSESFCLSPLPHYDVGGNIHIIINNQIGFTTLPNEGSKLHYCTDMIKGADIPIFHINGDSIDTILFATKIACEYRQKFAKDIILDIICYRRNGHNDVDESTFTQPQMYSLIKEKPIVSHLYQKQLIHEKVISENECKRYTDNVRDKLQKAYAKALENSKNYNNSELIKEKELIKKTPSANNKNISIKQLINLGEKLFSIPNDFYLHSRLKSQFDKKLDNIRSKKAIDWSTAESLALANILNQGHNVRLSGQDSGRGTFSQRHAILYDQNNGNHYIPLKQISKEKGEFTIINSPLSEMAILGFEYGYSLRSSNALTIWEAQFGDFVNGAQVIIDQFITAGEDKWQEFSNLMLLLPHGYEGQGAEHSSARIERFLQSCAKNNIVVANCTTPANYFHLLCRQVYCTKPLILFTPKSLLRHPQAVSPIQQLSQDKFYEVLKDASLMVNDNKNCKIILCSGKVYYDLCTYRTRHNIDNVGIIRLEQLYPFPEQALQTLLSQYSLQKIIWCQEEPRNMGAWHYLQEPMRKLISQLSCSSLVMSYAGRAESAATASGSSNIHQKEQDTLIHQAFCL